MQISRDRETIQKHVISFIVPQEILQSFEIEKIEEREEDMTVYLVEKEILKPESDEPLLKNGYMNPIDIMHFPITGKKCFLRLKRRRWKGEQSGKDNYVNQYDYTEKGNKATRAFGAFLKENNR